MSDDLDQILLLLVGAFGLFSVTLAVLARVEARLADPPGRRPWAPRWWGVGCSLGRARWSRRCPLEWVLGHSTPVLGTSRFADLAGREQQPAVRTLAPCVSHLWGADRLDAAATASRAGGPAAAACSTSIKDSA